MGEVSAVVFDIGNVLVEWHPEEIFDARIGAENREKMFREARIDEMNERVDLGEDIKAVVEEHAKAHPKWQHEILMWNEWWLDMCAPAINHSAVLLRALRARGIPVFALSNFGVSTYRLAQKAYPVLTEFDREFVSGFHEMVKPNPAFYQLLEDETGVEPSQLLFADDRDNNIAAAHARGWKTHLFKDAAGFADRLVSEGLLSSEDSRP